MRRLALTCSILGTLLAAGCAPPSTSGEDPASEAKDSIVYGSSDSSHTAVLALLIPASGGYFSACTGTVVKMSGTTAYVLTAAHCCNNGAPSLAVMAQNYAPYEQYVFGGNPPAPAYKVDSNSVYYDSAYNGNTHDFCMLKVPGVPSSTPAIPVATGNDGVTLGTQLQHVGYGQTEQDVQNPNSPNQNTSRRKGTNTANVQVTSTIIQYSQGGSGNTPGPCHGDSGGPALTPYNAASQTSQKVVGVTSYGTGSGECIGAGAQGVSVRVTSVTGANGFVTNYLNDTPTGTKAGSTSAGNCSTCQQDTLSPGGACSSTYNACTNNAACNTLLSCLGNCGTQTCADNCWNAAGATGQNLYNNVINCICNTGCSNECSAECGGTSTGCGLQAQDANCDMCLTGKCCNQASACAGNQTCLDCLSTGSTSCNNNSQYVSLITCLQNNCNVECLGGSTSSSSSSSSSGSTSSSSSSSSSGSASSSSGSASSSSGSASSSSGTGTGGAPATGGAGPVGGGDPAGGAPQGTGGSSSNNDNDADQDSGCSVSGAGSDSGSDASYAALLLGAALAFVRRRKSQKAA
jgi:MYXO-CTERM domain-containing protein